MLSGSCGTTGDNYSDPTAVKESVKDYYGKQLQTTKDLKTTACTACGRPPAHVRAALKRVPKEVTEKFYGCGNPIPTGIEGLDVLDLGSGSGRDCYVAALMTGKAGSVVGIDMTQEQIDVAIKHEAAFREANPESGKMKFLKGYIEDIEGAGVPAESVDLVISNCVVNLSPNKKLVLEGAYRALKPGGEFYFSDVYVDRRLPEEVRRHELLFGECLAGALYIGDFISLCKQVQFADPRQLAIDEIIVHDKELAEICGAARFYSITYRLFKLPNRLEPQCEDYGQIAIYKGTLPDQPFRFTLDKGHQFEKGRPSLVCGNTASMLEETYLKRHFTVIGNRDTHFGAFDCSGGAPACSAVSAPANGGGECGSGSCGEGGCC